MLEEFNNKKVIILGDVILDHYIFGRADGVSPEAAVLVLLHESETYRLGGAANVAWNIKALGATPILLTAIGNDMAGRELAYLLKAENISDEYLIIDESRPTTIKTRFLAKHQQLLRHDKESSKPLAQAIEDKVFASLKALIEKGDIAAVVLQDYNKGVLTANLIKAVVSFCKENNVATVVDPKKNNLEAYTGTTLFKPNLREMGDAFGLSLSESYIDFELLNKIGLELKAKLQLPYLCITLGAQGMYVFDKENKAVHVPTRARAVADVCGAGDTVISTLTLAMAANMPITEAAQLANLAGGQVCEKIGVVAVDKAQLINEWLNKS